MNSHGGRLDGANAATLAYVLANIIDVVVSESGSMDTGRFAELLIEIIDARIAEAGKSDA